MLGACSRVCGVCVYIPVCWSVWGVRSVQLSRHSSCAPSSGEFVTRFRLPSIFRISLTLIVK